MSAKAPLLEVFSSVQGEGRFVGRPMVFVRVAVCPIRCLYCDTPASYRAPARFEVRDGAALMTPENPVAALAAADLVATNAACHPFGRATWVALTGGEPLLYPDFVAVFGAAVRARGLRLLLETAALDVGALEQCLSAIDHLSADYKLPGTLASGDEESAGIACVAAVAAAIAAGKTVDVKLVLTAAVTESAFATALARLEPWCGRFELVLQPVTPTRQVREPCSGERVAHFARLASVFAPLVLPQVHKQLGLD